MSNETTASWQAGDTEANGVRLHYTRTDGNKPPLVLSRPGISPRPSMS